jgi:hypothetical protein
MYKMSLAPGEGFEPPTKRLTAACSTTELPGINEMICSTDFDHRIPNPILQHGTTTIFDVICQSFCAGFDLSQVFVFHHNSLYHCPTSFLCIKALDAFDTILFKPPLSGNDCFLTGSLPNWKKNLMSRSHPYASNEKDRTTKLNCTECLDLHEESPLIETHITMSQKECQRFCLRFLAQRDR